MIVEDGNLFIAGDFSSSADLNPSDTVTMRTSRSKRCIFGSYSTTGAAQLAPIGGPGGDGNDWRLSSDSGSLYLTGFISEPADFDPSSGSTVLSPVGGNDAVIAKYSKNGGTLQLAKSFGSTGNDDARSEVVVNPIDGSIYWGGVFTGSVDFNPNVPGGELTSVGAQDAFLMKLDQNGGYLNAWRMGGSGSDGGIKPIGVFGNTIYATGRFEGTADFPTGDTLTSYGNSDGFLMALDESTLASSSSSNGISATSTSGSSINDVNSQLGIDKLAIDNWIESVLSDPSQMSKRKRALLDSVDEVFMNFANSATGGLAIDWVG
ncbi:MAG: hypothetical protein U0905_20675 [Pirellulales bacterium]